MGPEELRKALLAAITDPEVIAVLKTQIIDPAIEKAVLEATQAKDREISVLKEELKATKQKMNELEQYSRRNCLIISGLPESSGEDVSKLVKQLCRAAGVDIDTIDIDAAHRLGKPTKSKPRNVIVKFTTFVKRQQLYAARKQLRSAEPPADSVLSRAVLDGCFVSEQLTAQNATTMYAARQMRAKDKLCHTWTDGCRMKVRVTERAPTRVIGCIEDLIKIVGPDSLLESLIDGSETPRPGGASAGDRGGDAGERDAGESSGGGESSRRTYRPRVVKK